MKTLILLIAVIALTGCTTNYDRLAHTKHPDYPLNYNIFAGYYVDSNNQIKPFHLP